MSVLDLTAPQSRDVTRRYQADILATGKIERVVKNYRRKDGSLVPVELVIDVLRDDSGKPLGLYAFITDISERARAEEAVVDSERRTRALFEGSLDAIVVADGEGHITLFNPAAEKIFGYASRRSSISRSHAHARHLRLPAPDDRRRAGPIVGLGACGGAGGRRGDVRRDMPTAPRRRRPARGASRASWAGPWSSRGGSRTAPSSRSSSP